MVTESAVTPGSVPAELVPVAGPQGEAMSPKVELPPAWVVFVPPLSPPPESERPPPQAVATMLMTATTATSPAMSRVPRDRVRRRGCTGSICSPLGTVRSPL